MNTAKFLSTGMLVALMFGCGSGDSPDPVVATVASAGKEKSPVAIQSELLSDRPSEKATGTPGPVYRFAKLSNGAYFFTGSSVEKNDILANFPDFRYEGIAYLNTGDGPGQPVYRFANLRNGGYFYTADTAERDSVRSTRSDLRYEGSTFSVDGQTAVGSVPVYRLANIQNGAYLYTISNAERQYAVGLGFWRDEGISFYALPESAFPAATASVCFNPTLYTAGTSITESLKVGNIVYVRETEVKTRTLSGQPIIVHDMKVKLSSTIVEQPFKYFKISGTDVSELSFSVSGTSSAVVDFTKAIPFRFFSLPPGNEVHLETDFAYRELFPLNAIPIRGTASVNQKFEGYQDITTSLGVFRNTCKFTSNLTLATTSQIISTQITSYYARGSGLLVREVSTQSGSSTTQDLVGATINGTAVVAH